MLIENCKLVWGNCLYGSGHGEIEKSFAKPVHKRRSRPLNNMSFASGFKCPYCNKSYNGEKNLLIHMKLECGGQRSYFCRICPDKFSLNIELRRHLLGRHDIYMPPKFLIPKKIFAV
ncbi:hypothetical protein PV326_004907 [Microctonus aethiopoides]|nr:hypothetical protein PV326_004907 [Microctonus aethiopoides]